MDAIVAAALNEISARGVQGCLVEDLWSGIEDAVTSEGLHICDGVKQAIWQALLKVPGLSFVSPSSSKSKASKEFDASHSLIQAVEDAEKRRINIVAAEHLRDSCLGLYDLKCSDAGLSSAQRTTLERLAKARKQGVTQSQLAKEFGLKGNNMFYIVRSLESRGLLVRQSTLVRTEDGGCEAENGSKFNSTVNTNLIHLPRYAKHWNLGSQQRFEIRMSSIPGTVKNLDANIFSGRDFSGEGTQQDVHIKDDLQSMKAICDKLEKADGKVLVVSDLKVALGYRLIMGHRAWRRMSKRLQTAGFVEVLQAQVDKKVVSCMRLLKSFNPRAFDPKSANCGNADVESEQPLKAGKRGEVTEQLVELPIDHQIYDMIDNEGSKGLIVTEIWKRLGLKSKRNYCRFTNMVSRFCLHLQAESRKRATLYRVKTSANANCSINNDSANTHHGVLEHFSKGDLRLGDNALNGNSQSCSSTMKTLSNRQKVSAHHREWGKKAKKSRLELDEDKMFFEENKVSPHFTASPPLLRACQRYPCITVTTVRAQREQRILDKLQVDQFILKAELYRWLEELEKGKSTTMDRKTLSRALQKLEHQGHCKCIVVKVPVVTNCGRHRTTEVVLRPSVEVGPELLSQIHIRLRAFDTQIRKRGLSRLKTDEHVPILTGIKRISNTEGPEVQAVRADSVDFKCCIRAKMARVKMLHQFLWGYVRNLPDWDAALSSGQNGCYHSNSNLFSLITATKAMPLELFLQVIGSTKQNRGLSKRSRHGVRLCDLPQQEFNILLNTTGELSSLIDVLRRLKLLHLVMGKGHSHLEAVLTYSLDLKPYIEEPATRAVPSLISHVFGLRPRKRHGFVFSCMEEVNAYWKTLEYCFGGAEQSAAAHAFPGSAVPELFHEHSWTSVQVMTLDQQRDLLKRVANYNHEKLMPFKECLKISRDLSLTLEQVLRVTYNKNQKACLQTLKKEETGISYPTDGVHIGSENTTSVSSKRKRAFLDESPECVNTEVPLKQKSMQHANISCEYIDENQELCKKSHARSGACKNICAQSILSEETDQDDHCEEYGDKDLFSVCSSFLIRLKPARKRVKFIWCDKLDKDLIAIYAREKAMSVGQHCHFEWGMISGLPAPPEACQRRIALMRSEPLVRKALLKLCSLLASRFVKNMQITGKGNVVNDTDVYSTDGPDNSLVRSQNAHVHNSSANYFEIHSSDQFRWDDFEEPSIAEAIDEVLKYMAESSAVRHYGVSSSFVTKGSESASSERVPSVASVQIGLHSAYGVGKDDSVSGNGVLASANSSACTLPSQFHDEQPASHESNGGNRTRTIHHFMPKTIQSLPKKNNLGTEELVYNSIAVANAVELLKLVFLKYSPDAEVPKILVDTLRCYNESDVLAAFNFLQSHALVVAGQDAESFALSQKFYNNTSASPFAVGMGDETKGLAKWLSKVEKDLEEDWVNLPIEHNIDDIFHLLSLVSCGELLIIPKLPSEGFGETNDVRCLKRRNDNKKASPHQCIRKPEIQWQNEGGFDLQWARGFPGVQVCVQRASFSTVEITTRNLNNKDQIEDPQTGIHSVLSMKSFDCEIDPTCSNRPELVDSPPIVPNLSPMPSSEISLEAFSNFSRNFFCSSKTIEHEEPGIFEPELFRKALDAIEVAGEEGLSMAQVAQSVGLEGNCVDHADAIVETLQFFNYVKKVNAFDHVRAVTSAQSGKYFLRVPSGNTADNKPVHTSFVEVTGGSASFCDMRVHNSNQKETNSACPKENEGLCKPDMPCSMGTEREEKVGMCESDGHLVTILESMKRETIDVPIYPWLTCDGETNSSIFKALTRRVLGIIIQHPGMLEADLIRWLDILNPQSARKLLQVLELDDYLHVRTCPKTNITCPGILKSLIGFKVEEQITVWQRHYYVNPMSSTML